MIKNIETPEMRHWASVRACAAILDTLKKDGEIYRYILVRDNSPLDKLGVDIRLLMKRVNSDAIFEIPVQVKSSKTGLDQHFSHPNQHIDAVCNAEGFDLVEQFLDIIDKHTRKRDALENPKEFNSEEKEHKKNCSQSEQEIGVSQAYFLVDLNLLDHWLWPKDRPYTDSEAWIWLLGKASRGPNTQASDKKTFIIQHGEILSSVREMANIWRWSRKRVSNFLKTLEKTGMISIEKYTRYDSCFKVLSYRKDKLNGENNT